MLQFGNWFQGNFVTGRPMSKYTENYPVLTTKIGRQQFPIAAKPMAIGLKILNLCYEMFVG